MQDTSESMGVTGTQSRVLQFISEESKVREVFQKDIEEAFQVRRSTVTQILQLMERDGLIVRESVERDARLKKLIPTAKGYEIEQVMKGQISDMEEKLAKNLTSEEKEMLITILGKIRKNLE
jgi:DNA-binding MarR family transcriptional regulator